MLTTKKGTNGAYDNKMKFAFPMEEDEFDGGNTSFVSSEKNTSYGNLSALTRQLASGTTRRSGGPKKLYSPQSDQNLVPGLLSLPDRIDQMEVLTGGSVLVPEGDNLEEHVHYNASYQLVYQEYYCSLRGTTLQDSPNRPTQNQGVTGAKREGL